MSLKLHFSSHIISLNEARVNAARFRLDLPSDPVNPACLVRVEARSHQHFPWRNMSRYVEISTLIQNSDSGSLRYGLGWRAQ